MTEPTQCHEVEVRLGGRPYSIHVGPGMLARTGTLLRALEPASRIVVVTSPTVAAFYSPALEEALVEVGAGLSVRIDIPDGEDHKTLATVEKIYDAVLERGIDRSTILVALGGGVVGDLAGFAAATLLRGIRLVMVPTTLLAQVDSSVGGKTGFNRPQGKNLVGTFLQPSLVVADPETLTTLPERELRAGLAEVVKYGMILDADLFELLEARSADLVACAPDLMTLVVARGCALKARIVEQDEMEVAVRRILNFGHTVGHAIEKVTEYRRFRHGEAVAIGMVAAARISLALGACKADVPVRVEQLLSSLGLPTDLSADLSLDAIEEAIAFDKKARGARVSFVLSEGIGRCRQQLMSPAEIVAPLRG